ncbi:universal stress protein [Halomarina ordinaria]|uniref:Universal stress protein n=1 Tax=Halomarina ordinaria TaxID=3033939 RepID=A0ABD5UC35_9EURY|nr:universal stress protein [Halomarina sp. PSRA2]
MYEHLLIPYDGSDEGRKGALHGIELAAALDADVHAIYVIELPGAPRALSIRDDEEQLRREYREYGEEILSEICDAATSRGVDCHRDILSGSVSDRIVEYADEEGMDAIVMGSAYRGKIGTLLGGTTDKVVRTATVPVVSQRMGVDEL